MTCVLKWWQRTLKTESVYIPVCVSVRDAHVCAWLSCYHVWCTVCDEYVSECLQQWLARVGRGVFRPQGWPGDALTAGTVPRIDMTRLVNILHTALHVYCFTETYSFSYQRNVLFSSSAKLYLVHLVLYSTKQNLIYIHSKKIIKFSNGLQFFKQTYFHFIIQAIYFTFDVFLLTRKIIYHAKSKLSDNLRI